MDINASQDIENNQDLISFNERRSLPQLTQQDVADYQKRRDLNFEYEVEYDHKGIRDHILGVNTDNDIDEDYAERMIKLHLASQMSLSGKKVHPSEMDYDAVVHSYFGDRAPTQKKADVFRVMKQSIVPEPDEGFYKLRDFNALTPEEQWEQVKKDVPGADYDVGRTGGGYNYMTGETYQPEDTTSDEVKNSMIEKHRQKLFSESDFVIKALGKKKLPPRLQKYAFDLSLGTERGSFAFESATPEQQAIFFPYVRSLNSAVDGSLTTKTWERLKQTFEDRDLGKLSTMEKLEGVMESDIMLNHRMREADILGGYDFLNGKWYGDEAKGRAQQFMDDQIDKASSKQGMFGFGLDPVDVDSPEFHARMKAGQQKYDNTQLRRKIKNATRKMFQMNLAEEILVEGTAMTADLIPVMASTIATGGLGGLTYTGSVFFGDFVDDLVYDHNVDISDALAIGVATTAPYALIEKAQGDLLLKLTTPASKDIGRRMIQAFPDWVKKNGGKFMVDSAKGYVGEVAQESAQSAIEQLGRAYAKAFAEAEGIEYDDLVKNWWEETVMATKAMIVPAVGMRAMQRVAGGKGGSFGNEEMARNIDKLYGDVEMMPEADRTKFENVITNEIRVAYDEAQTMDERQAVLDEYDTGLTVDQVETYDNMTSQIDEFYQAERAQIQQDFEAQGIELDPESITDQMIDTRRRVQTYQQTINEFADIEMTGADQFIVKGKDGGAEVNLNIVDQMPQQGAYDPNSNTVTLPRTAEDFTFTHEISHAMRDLGLINDADWSSLVDYGTKLINEGKVEGYKSVDELQDRYRADKEGLHHEIVAHAMEQGRREGAPAEVRNIAQRAWDWITSLIGYATESSKQRQTVQDVFQGKPLQGNIPMADPNIPMADPNIPMDDNTETNAGISEEENAERVKRFSLAYKDPSLGYTFTYDKDSQKWQDLIDQGYITTDKTLSDFEGATMLLHQPDGAFSGDIKQDGQLLVEGKGGVFYPIKYHDENYFWASTENASNKMASDLNKIAEANDGKIYMALTSAPVEKLLSSTTMSNAVLDFFINKSKDRKVKVSKKDVENAIIDSANHVMTRKVQGKEKKVSLGLKLKKSDSFEDNLKKIKTALGADQSVFDARKNFSIQLIRNMSDIINKRPDAVQQFGEFFTEGINNKYFKGKTSTGKLKISSANMTQALSDMLSEPIVKPFQEKATQGGFVYAVLELDGNVQPVDSDKHESYPKAIQSAEGGKTKLHILEEAPHWSSVVEDPTTGEIVQEDRYKKVYPSSGVSTGGVKINTTSAPMRFSLAPPTDSKAFKNWFGDSKVVNEDGSPKVVYHGTTAEFTEFKPSTSGEYGYGIYLGDNRGQASFYGDNVMEVYAKIQNPFYVDKTDYIDMTLEEEYDVEFEDFEPIGPRVVNDRLIEKGYDGIIATGINGVEQQIIAFSPTQIKSATDNVGTFDPANPDIRYSLTPYANEKRLATVAISDRMIKGTINDERADEIMDAFGIEDADREAVMANAQQIVDEMGDEAKNLSGKRELTKALASRANQLEYRERLRDLQMSAREGGEIYERARQTLQKRKKMAREMDIQTIPEESFRNIVGDFKSSIIEGEPNTTGMDQVTEAIRRQMVSNGLITERNKVGFKKMPEYRSTLARTLKDVANELISDLSPGTRKQQLKQQARQLVNYATTPAVENNFNKLVDKISDSVIRQTQKELRADFNKTLKPFKKAPKAVENRKRTVDGQAHLLLFYANKYKGLSPEKYNEELSLIQTELEKYRDSDQASEQIKFNEYEIRENALVAFGGIDRSETRSSDVVSANDYANQVIEDGKALTERLDQAHREKYEPITKDIFNAIEQAKPFVTKKDEKAWINQMSQMNVRGQLEFITAYGTKEQKASLEKVLLANDASKVKKMEMIERINDELIEKAKGLGIDKLDNFQREASKEKEEYRKFSHEERTALSDADLMTIHMAFRQPDIIERALRTNDSGQLMNPELKRRYDMKDQIAEELGAQKVALAELMGDVIDSVLPDVNETYRKQFGVDLKVQPVNYFPLKVQVKKGGFKMYMSGIASAPSFTIARTQNTNDLDERANIFEVFAGHISDASHYVTTFDSSMGIRSTMTNRFTREAIRQTYGDPTLADIDDSIVDMVADRPVQSGENRKEIDVVRSWMSNISIGFNPKSMLVALTGTINAFAVRKGIIPAVTGAMRNPESAMEDIKMIHESIVLKERREMGINESMQNARRQAKGSKWMEMYTNWAYMGLTTVDSLVASVMGGVIYNQYKNSEQAQGLSEEQVKANGLAIVNRFVQEAYQPTGNDFMPADIRRGGSFEKSFFQFLTEPKSKLGIYLKDIRQAKAKYKQGDKQGAVEDMIRIAIGQHILIPTAYWFAGELMRYIFGDDDENEGALNRLAVGILVGPASGVLVWGAGIEIMAKIAMGDKVFYGSSIPSDRIMQEIGFIIKNTTSDEDILEKVDNTLERYIPVYKYTKKKLENN